MTLEATTTPAAPAAPAATAPAAPAAAPAAPQVPAASAPAAAVEQGAFGPSQSYEPTGDAGLDLALSFVGKAGLAADHPAMVAAAQGDFSILKAELAAKGVAGWEQHVALGEAWFARDAASKEAAAAATSDMVVQIAGSAEDWQAAADWASVNADQNEKDAINTALAAGGLQAEMAAVWLMHTFRSAPGTSYQGKSAVSANAAPASPGQGAGPLDPSSYGLEVAKLRAKLGSRMEGSPEYGALQKRRMAFRG